MKKRLTKSKNKICCGVFGGIAEYFGWDLAIVRIIGAFLIIFPGSIFAGLLLYFIAALVMPDGIENNTDFKQDDIIEGQFYEKDE